MLRKAVGCCRAWVGKTGGAIWVCLDFWAPPFVLRQKVEKRHLRRITKSRKSLAAMHHQAQHETSAGDKKQVNHLK
jgi:hypothetical protein